MRRIAVAGAVLAAAMAVPPTAAIAGSHKADGKLGDWVGKPTMIAGHTTTSRGEYIYTDWLYDDYGPDLDGAPNSPAFRAQLAPTRGDYRYPDDEARYGNNAADLRELRVAVDKTTLHLMIALQTMRVANAAVVQVALDVDGKDSTPKHDAWPDGAGITTRGPGHFVTTAGNSAHLTLPNGKTRKLTSVANTKANAIEVDVPLSALGKLSSRPRIWVVTGLNDGHGKFMQQQSGATAVFNAGFRHFEPYPKGGADLARFDGGGWSESRQATALAAGDVSAFAGRFDVARLRVGESDRSKPIAPGHYVRIFKSKKNYGEGIDLKGGNSGSGEPNIGGNPAPEFKSPYQEYALYIPKGYDPHRPNVFTLNGHSLDCSHLEYFTVAPNQQKQLGDERKSIIVTPLSRGADTWFMTSGLVDTLEAWNDARRHYKVDDDRTFITGYSMGGFMTYRLGLLMPDRFSKASVYVGPPAYQLWPYPAPPTPGDHFSEVGNTNKIVENAFDLPYEINHGNADELVPVAGVQHQVDTFNAAGNSYVFYRHAGNDHFSFILNDEWSHTRDFLGTAPRAKNPVQVRFRRYPAMDLPKDGLRFDRAYWVSGIKVGGSQTNTDNSGFVDAVTHGLGGHLPKPGAETITPVTGPVTPGTKFARPQVAGNAIAVANALDVKLTNVVGATIELRRIGLTMRKNLKIHLENDRTVDLILRGSYRKVNVIGGTLFPVRGGVSLHVTPGKRDLTLVAG